MFDCESLIKYCAMDEELLRTMYTGFNRQYFVGQRLDCAILCPVSKGFGVSPRKFFKIYIRKMHFPAF